jgi:serine O-acetyltransferase
MQTEILKDLYRYEGNACHSLKMQLRYIAFTPGFRFTFFFRKASAARNPFCKMLWRILHRWCMERTGIQIPVGTEIGEGFRIAHFGTIVVNPGAKIGKNFTIAEGCLVGNAQGKRKGVPTIGDNVQMSANSVVLGGVNIGSNVLLAPGAFANFDVHDNSIVIGNPGQIIRRDSSPTKKYIVYSVDDFE